MSVLFALAAGATVATADASPGLTGLWEGTVGKYPVMVCLTADETYTDRGSYYYGNQLIPIRLERDDDRPGEWTEGYQDDGPRWTAFTVRDGRMTATWSDGKRSLPVQLVRKEYSPANDWAEGPCASAEYITPRLFERQIATKPAQFQGWDYRIVEWKPPRHFAENAYVTLEYDPVEPGDRQIISQLRDRLPDGKLESDFIQCMVGNLSWHGVDGDMARWSEPNFVNREFLGISTTHGSYCGGAHPNYWQEFGIYDRQSGELLDPTKRWFTIDGFANSDHDNWVITPALREVALHHYPPDQEEECLTILEESSFWYVGLQPEGLVFLPSVPHVAIPCAEPVIVPWDDAAPFLSEEGQQARTRAGG